MKKLLVLTIVIFCHAGARGYPPVSNGQSVPTPCPTGTYGKDAAAGCKSCAAATGNQRATSARGAESIKDCFIPADTVLSEKYGTYKFATDCYWQ
ncbi:MAG: hypothetical protein LBL21_01355 [Rickettsiales bacterium]|jgi:hypothetical protein|nr:hypothetical protein [Rickettsiales bacterium]